MPEINETTEVASELVLEQVDEQLDNERPFEENSRVALSTMLMALLAAFGALMAGISAQDALLERTAEIIDTNIRESDRVIVEVLKTKHEILTSIGETPDIDELAQIESYERATKQYEEKTTLEEEEIQALVWPHLMFAIAVTLISVGIALNGIAIVTRKQLLWYIGMLMGLVGSLGIGAGVVLMVVS